MKSEHKRRVYYDPCQEKVYEKKGVACCEHYPEGLPVCGKCREESTLAHDKACAELADCKADRVAISQKLSDALDALFASNKQLAEANRKLAERINDDQRYLVAPLCNAEKALDDCQAELAEARAEIESKDRLIEQMRGALTKLIGTLEVMSVMPETLGKCPVLAIDAPELEQARAALAAERGER